MADDLTIHIRLNLVRENLSKGEACEVSADEVLAMLREAGFIRNADGSFLCEEISLGWLNRDEWSSKPVGSICACGYDLRATPNRCPECGRTF